MDLKILGSSSAGNCYVLDNGKEALVIEAGVRFDEVKKAVGFEIGRIAGCLVSHEHGDHARYVQKFIDARIPVYMSAGTYKSLSLNFWVNRGLCLDAHTTYGIGKFDVRPFNVKHDATEPLGFLIRHPETGTVLFATDTYYLEYTFNGLNNVLIECNYRQDILDANYEAGLVPKAQRDRTIESHMSYDTCRETLLANDLRTVNNIVLVHLSDGNSNEAEFREGIAEATGKQVHVADKGMKLNFGKTPF
jgi:phosphoribosyl 1,2-cyclic phosphodiesterase